MLNLLAALGILFIIVFLGWRVLFARRIERPCCTNCRYEVEGLPTSICPECGADLQKAGILQPRRLGSLSLTARIGLWTIFAACVAAFAVQWFDQRLPAPRLFSISVLFGPPRSGAYERLSINGRQTSREQPTMRVDRLVAQLTRADGSTSQLAINLKRRRASFEDSLGRDHDAFINDEESAADLIFDWLSINGPQGRDDLLNSEAIEIARLIRTGEHFSNPETAGIVRWSDAIRTMTAQSPLGAIAITRSIVPAPDRWRWLILAGPLAGLWLMGVMMIMVFHWIRRIRASQGVQRAGVSPAP